MKFSKVSLTLLTIQLLLIGSIAAKYLYQRTHCPHLWVKTAAYDPNLPIRGRYMELSLVVDGCEVFSPSDIAKFHSPNNMEAYTYSSTAVSLEVAHDKLIAHRLPLEDWHENANYIQPPWRNVNDCHSMLLTRSVDFFVPEHAELPSQFDASHEIWVEVTVPPKGPPRPIQMAVKENGQWKPLHLN